MIRHPPRSTLSSSSAASDVYKRQVVDSPSLREVETLANEAPLLLSPTKLGSPPLLTPTSPAERIRSHVHANWRQPSNRLERFRSAQSWSMRREAVCVVSSPELREVDSLARECHACSPSSPLASPMLLTPTSPSVRTCTVSTLVGGAGVRAKGTRRREPGQMEFKIATCWRRFRLQRKSVADWVRNCKIACGEGRLCQKPLVVMEVQEAKPVVPDAIVDTIVSWQNPRVAERSVSGDVDYDSDDPFPELMKELSSY
eukprot:TRINITY_DN10924_c0_g1_i4.p1 TRINITY_DN10924_c0_g1~~TRINITY_DN10924_c0_g1_i4.p1  ORF type:complete len:257 (+),score=35.02 TRINITY_DN10924_c0_g1_i4:53-823(+)